MCECGRNEYKQGKCNTCYRKQWPTKKETPEANRARLMKQRYGITPEEYDAMFRAQGGVCAICRKATEGPLNVDHSHTTAEVRGLLCGPCNRALGLLRADQGTDLIEAALAYVGMSYLIDTLVHQPTKTTKYRWDLNYQEEKN